MKLHIKNNSKIMQYLLTGLLFLNYCSYAQSNESNFITAFSQGRAGNCASIAAIKLSIATYGIQNIFLEEKHINNAYHILMRDSSLVVILDSEILEMDSNQNRFRKGSDREIYNYATFLYAVMAKNKQKQLGLKTIKKANIYYKWNFIPTTNHLLAMDTEKNLDYLGLKGLYKEINRDEVSKFDKIIITSTKHSTFATNGNFDDHGEIVQILDFEKKYRKLNAYGNYILKK